MTSQTQEDLPPDDDYPYYKATVTESSLHYKAGAYLHEVLQQRFEDRSDIFVGADNFVYWQEGNKKLRQAPDVYVCFGASNRDRRSYKTWEENGIFPQVIFEITSKSSRFTDVGTKKAVYEALGVEEYYLFDPLKEYIPEGFLAFRLQDQQFVRLKAKRVHSPRLGLDLRAEGKLLRFFLPDSSQRLLTYRETEKARLAAERARAAAEQARAEAEQRAERLSAELEELRRQLKRPPEG